MSLNSHLSLRLFFHFVSWVLMLPNCVVRARWRRRGGGLEDGGVGENWLALGRTDRRCDALTAGRGGGAGAGFVYGYVSFSVSSREKIFKLGRKQDRRLHPRDCGELAQLQARRLLGHPFPPFQPPNLVLGIPFRDSIFWSARFLHPSCLLTHLSIGVRSYRTPKATMSQTRRGAIPYSHYISQPEPGGVRRAAFPRIAAAHHAGPLQATFRIATAAKQRPLGW